ncbi:MAG: SAM-dependent methyltransferase, partial [Gaiellales bacterium]
RMSLAERSPADLCLALALIHHLAIANNVPLPRIARFLAEVSLWAVVEFVPKGDEKVSLLLLNREDIFPDYTVDGFERAIAPWFEVDQRVTIPGSGRVLYLLKRRQR